MKQNHEFIIETDVVCVRENCGQKTIKRFKVEYTTNQKGDPINQKVIVLK